MMPDIYIYIYIYMAFWYLPDTSCTPKYGDMGILQFYIDKANEIVCLGLPNYNIMCLVHAQEN